MFPILQQEIHRQFKDVNSFVTLCMRDFNSDKWGDITWENKYNKGLYLARKAAEIVVKECYQRKSV